MSSRSRAFQIKIVGDVNDAKRSLKSMEKRVGKFSQAMKGVAGVMAGAFAARAVFNFVGGAIKRAEEMNSLYSITEEIIERTGSAAGKTAGEVKAMARQMSLATGIDKQIITTGTNVLLTFKNIADQAGANNDIFSRSNAIMLDMATVFGGDAKQSATQLGKALNDPIRGVTALARVGVQFTDQQREQIRTLQESGDILGAQRIILDELEGQVGGTAVASADATAKLANMAKEAKESIGNKLLPIVAKLATFLTNKVVPAFSSLSAWISKHVPPWYKKHIAPTVERIRAIIAVVMAWMSAFWVEHGDKITAYITTFVAVIWALYKALFTLITTAVEAAMKIVAWVWERYGDKIMKVVRAWWSVVSSVVGLITGTLQDLVRFVTAVFTGDWAAAWDIAKDIAMRFLDWFVSFPAKIVDVLRSAVGLVGSAAADLGRAIVNGIIGFWNKLDPRITIGPMPSWLPGIGGQSWTSPDLFPDIPRLAKGGIVTGPTLALIGEGRYDEAVIPLRPGMGLGGGITVNITTGVGDPVAIGEAVVEAVVAYERHTGTGWRTATEYSHA